MEKRRDRNVCTPIRTGSVYQRERVYSVCACQFNGRRCETTARYQCSFIRTDIPDYGNELPDDVNVKRFLMILAVPDD